MTDATTNSATPVHIFTGTKADAGTAQLPQAGGSESGDSSTLSMTTAQLESMFISAQCDSAHAMMQACLKKPIMHDAQQLPTPVPGLMLVRAVVRTKDGSNLSRLLMVLMNQVPGEACILPQRVANMRRRALMFSATMTHKYLCDPIEPLYAVHLDKNLMVGHDWRDFDAPMRHQDGSEMTAAERRKHTVEIYRKDGSKKHRPITILNNMLVMDSATWFLVSLAGEFGFRDEADATDETLRLREYTMKTLPFVRFQTGVMMLKDTESVVRLGNGDAAAANAKSTRLPCVINSIVLDVPFDDALNAFENGVKNSECMLFCKDMVQCLKNMSPVGPYKPVELPFLVVSMHQRLRAAQLSLRARAMEQITAIGSEQQVADADAPVGEQETASTAEDASPPAE